MLREELINIKKVNKVKRKKLRRQKNQGKLKSLMNKQRPIHKIMRMLPPGKIRYFYSTPEPIAHFAYNPYINKGDEN
jgi:hypothetical protein